MAKKASASRILAREKERRALQLRKAGVSYADIASEVGYKDHTGAAKAVKRAMERLPKEAGEDLRTLTVQRLETMMVNLWNIAMVKVPAQDGKGIPVRDDQGRQVMVDHPDKFRAIDRILMIQQQLIGLQGINAPAPDQNVNVKHSGGVMVIGGTKEEFIAGMKELAGIKDELSEAPINPLAATAIMVGPDHQVPSKHGPLELGGGD